MMARLVVNHPEDFCHRCLGSNLSWHIDSAVWNAVMRPEGQEEWLWSEIICPQCFAELFEAKFGPAHFQLTIPPESIGGRAFALGPHTMDDNCPRCYGPCGSITRWDEPDDEEASQEAAAAVWEECAEAYESAAGRGFPIDNPYRQAPKGSGRG